MFLNVLTQPQQEVFQRLASRVICADEHVDVVEQIQLMNIDKELGLFRSEEVSHAKLHLYLLLESIAHGNLDQDSFDNLQNQFFAEFSKDTFDLILNDAEDTVTLTYQKEGICNVYMHEATILNNLSDVFDSKRAQKVVIFELLLLAYADNDYSREQHEFITKVFGKLMLNPLILRPLERAAEERAALLQNIAVLLDIV